LFYDAEEKLDAAKTSLSEGRFADAIYQSYASGIHTAKGLLLQAKVHCNTQSGIISDFDKNFENQFQFEGYENFTDFILQINKNEPSEVFALDYNKRMQNLLNEAIKYRSTLLTIVENEKA
jgi:sulfite reductase (ferredoxin)